MNTTEYQFKSHSRGGNTLNSCTEFAGPTAHGVLDPQYTSLHGRFTSPLSPPQGPSAPRISLARAWRASLGSLFERSMFDLNSEAPFFEISGDFGTKNEAKIIQNILKIEQNSKKSRKSPKNPKK